MPPVQERLPLAGDGIALARNDCVFWRMPTMKIRVLGLLALLASGFAAAQSPPPPPADGAPDNAQREARHAAMLASCDADIKSFCADQQGRAVMHCLRNNSAQLSSSCKSALPKGHPPAGAPVAPST